MCLLPLYSLCLVFFNLNLHHQVCFNILQIFRKIGGQIEDRTSREVPTEGETLKLVKCEFMVENKHGRSLLQFALP